jgi:hypothetical protein
VLRQANETLGAEYFKTPRDIVRSFVGLLNVLEQNQDRKWDEFVCAGFIQRPEQASSVEEEIALGRGAAVDTEDDLQTFKL